MKQVSIKDRQG